MQRTQIYLPEDLRKEVDRQCQETGESMSGYIRKALEQKVEREKRQKVNLKNLAEEVVGSLKITDKEAQKWIKEIREDKRSSDDRLEKRWADAEKLNRKGTKNVSARYQYPHTRP